MTKYLRITHALILTSLPLEASASLATIGFALLNNKTVHADYPAAMPTFAKAACDALQKVQGSVQAVVHRGLSSVMSNIAELQHSQSGPKNYAGFILFPVLILCTIGYLVVRRPSAKDDVAQSSTGAFVALNVVTLLCGSQHAVIKDLVEASPPAAVNAMRFGIAAALSAPFCLSAPWDAPISEPLPKDIAIDVRSSEVEDQFSQTGVARGTGQALWRAGAELGGWMFAGFALQACGLQFTTASRSAFLLYLNVKLVPIFNLLLYGRQNDGKIWLSAFIAVVGTSLLSFDGGPPNMGDAFSLAAAIASALFILRLETFAKAFDSTRLSGTTLACSAAYCIVWAAIDLTLVEPERAAAVMASVSSFVPQLLYLSVVVTVIANWLQTFGQKGVCTAEAAIIYSLDPIYGAFFAWLFLGETLGPRGFAGGALVLFAVALSSNGLLGSVPKSERVNGDEIMD